MAAGLAGVANADTPVTGAVFTTDSMCSGVDLNIYQDQDAVNLNGGPHHGSSAGLPDGSYYVQVTDPDGTLLGTSVGSTTPQPVTVTGGVFDRCYQLSAILIKATDQTEGYDATGNNGGEYKVWVSATSIFEPAQSKTDNFKVKDSADQAQDGRIAITKFYDANGNGVKDGAEVDITGWKVHVTDGMSWDDFTPVNTVVFAPDDYTVSEYLPAENNWVPTTPSPVVVDLAVGETRHVEFGNLCVVPPGGLTIGYWSNKNGARSMTTISGLATVQGLPLWTAKGAKFVPTSIGAYQKWLLDANATNMANMLSAQLSALVLNVANHNVTGSAIVYGDGRTVDEIIAAAKDLLVNGNTVAAGPARTAQEQLKNLIDDINNNRAKVVSPTPCAFTFAQ